MKKLTMAELIAALGALFPERDTVLRSFGLATLGRQHVVMVGEPGTAKSLMARTWAACLGRSYFETLMHAYSTPEECFGPIALSGLQQDRYIRATKNYAPEAEIVMFDEVFKSNAGMLNALLTFLNERRVHNDGKVQTCPLMTCIGASNEFQEGPQLDALADRFLLRVMVPYIQDRAAFQGMLTAPAIVLPGTVDLATEQAATDAVNLTSDTVDAVVNLRFAFSTAGHRASDRRWRESMILVKANAHLSGRTSTEPEDLECLEHVLWKKPDEIVMISKLVQQVISPDGARAVQCLDEAKDLFARIPPAGADKGQYLASLGQIINDLREVEDRLQRMPTSKKVKSSLADVTDLRTKASKLALVTFGMS